MAVMATASPDRTTEVKGRLEAFAAEVLAEAMNRPVQMANGERYLRGLIAQGPRKSLEPMVERLGSETDYQSLQQFVADSPWDPAAVVRAVAERVAPEIEVEAWVLDDTGFPKDGERSPGVKRQYSGTLGKIGNCQIGVSVHAVGAKGTVPLGWSLYLPEEWCSDQERRARAKIATEIEFKTKPELGVELVQCAAGWDVPAAPVLGDQAYGENTKLRERLHDANAEYVLAVGAEASVFAPGTSFAVPKRSGKSGPPPARLRANRKPQSIGQLVAGLGADAWQAVTFRDGPEGEHGSEGEPMSSRFAFLRVRAAHRWHKGEHPPREEWLIAEWPEDENAPSHCWLSNLPLDAEPERLARLARLRWKIELDYKQLKGELGLDHYEAAPGLAGTTTRRSSPPPTASSPCSAYARKPSGRPDAAESGAALAASISVLGRPLPDLPTARRPRPTPTPPPPPRRMNLTKHY